MNKRNSSTTKYDFLSIGEIIVDLISEDVVSSLAEAKTFSRYIGGQAANLAMNMSRLGNRTAAVVSIGADGLGKFAIQEMSCAGVVTDFVQITPEAPTTTALITRQTKTPDFLINRGADAFLHNKPELSEAVRSSKIVHTSAFALSREPARATILSALQKARDAGATISLDPNFHPNIWPDTDQMGAVLQKIFRLVDITKPSWEDCTRLFGQNSTPQECADQFIQWGAKIVLISMGERGVHLAQASGEHTYVPTGNDLSVKDVTGAGDAFWAGFLTAYLRGLHPSQAAAIGQTLAEFKISQVGPIKSPPTWDTLLQRADNIKLSSN